MIYIHQHFYIILNRQKCSLNEISHNAAIGLIQRVLDRGVTISEVFVDTVGPPEKYQVRIIVIFIFNMHSTLIHNSISF